MKRYIPISVLLVCLLASPLYAIPFATSKGVLLQDSDGSSGGSAHTLKLSTGDWSVTGGVATLPTGASDNETLINRLIDADHADNNATGAGTRTDQSVTPAGLKSTIGVLFPGIDPSLTNESVVCVNATGKIGDCSNLTWDGNEMGLNGGILLGGKARIASGENSRRNDRNGSCCATTGSFHEKLTIYAVPRSNCFHRKTTGETSL